MQPGWTPCCRLIEYVPCSSGNDELGRPNPSLRSIEPSGEFDTLPVIDSFAVCGRHAGARSEPWHAHTDPLTIEPLASQHYWVRHGRRSCRALVQREQSG